MEAIRNFLSIFSCGCNSTTILHELSLGIWPEGADGTDINCTGRSKDQQLLATGDDFGKVHLFTYPCSQPRVSDICLFGIPCGIYS